MSSAVSGREAPSIADNGRCGPPTAARSLSLPVAPPKIRRSPAGRWRALVLIGVHLLMAVHIAHWLRGGSTLTPVEPSEAMEFSKHSIVNAGLIFFALAILSTLVLGRWFCGWGCHLVALQDLSRWLLLKLRIRPGPLRAGLLATVPLVAFLYMFVGPVVYRVLAGDSFALRGVHLTTDRFWATFPSWLPAALTFASCGLVIIYFLGAKGFCTYGCPYGAIFGAVDQLSPWRIRVTDACKGCGHCTAVCSSNVRVHQEVRDYGMVVDPGCMKCLDCVNVCPNDALYFGLGTPAMFAKPAAARRALRAPRGGTAVSAVQRRGSRRGHRITAPAATSRPRGWPAALARWGITSAFVFAAFAVFTGFDRDYAWQRSDWIVSCVLTAVSLGLLALFRGKSTRIQDYSPGEEALLGLFFLLAMVTFRDLYGLVAFLFALGLSALLAYLCLHGVLLFTRPNLALHGWLLRRGGRLQPGAYLFSAGGLVLAVFWAHSALLQYHGFAARQAEPVLQAALRPGPGGGAAKPTLPPAADLLGRALAHVQFVERWGLLPDEENTLRLARLELLAGRPAAFEQRMRRLVERHPSDTELAVELAAHLRDSGRPDEALAVYRTHLAHRPRALTAYLDLGLLLTALQRYDEAAQTYNRARQFFPSHAALHQNMGVLAATRGDLPTAVELFRRAVEADPRRAEPRVALGRALCELQRWPQAAAELEQAVQLDPRHPQARFYLGLAYGRQARLDPAQRELEAAVDLQPGWPEAHAALAEVLAARGDREGASAHLRRAGLAPREGTGP